MTQSFVIKQEDKVPARSLYKRDAELERIEWLKKRNGLDLKAISNHGIDPKQLRGVVENFIGAVQIPIGLAGPLLINGDNANGIFFAPLATVEGVVVISASRGASAINKSGGIRVKVLDQQMTRGPVFEFSNIDECLIFISWVKENFDRIKAESEKVTRHGKMTKIEDYIFGNSVHLRLCYTTGDAAGQNMTTIMSDACCMFIRENFEKETGVAIRFYIIEGNIAGDKKFNWLNYTSTRGIKVITETFLKKEYIEQFLHCPVKQFVAGINHGVSGSILSGTPGGFSINAANIIAAIYASTGNDLGCVFESSASHAYIKEYDDGVYWSTMFPNIVVGTVANAHRLPTQDECIKIMQCDQKGGALKLAEIIAAFSVALDVSTASSISNDTFGKAHRIWGRG